MCTLVVVCHYWTGMYTSSLFIRGGVKVLTKQNNIDSWNLEIQTIHYLVGEYEQTLKMICTRINHNL